MSEEVITNNLTERTRLVKRGRYLEHFTIGYNSLEGLIAAALIMVPIIVKEGIEALRGETCCDEACH